jgi:WD40 repeat protein
MKVELKEVFDGLFPLVQDELVKTLHVVKENKQVKKKLNAIVDKKRNLTFTFDFEYDYTGLLEFVSKHLQQEVHKFLLEIESDKKNKAREDILNRAYSFAHAQKETEKKDVEALISQCLDVLEEFFLEKTAKADRVLASKEVEAITKAIKKEIKNMGWNTTDNEIVSRYKLAQRLEIAWDEEIKNCPSMKLIDMNPDVFPKGTYESIGSRVSVDQKGGRKNHITLEEAIRLAWDYEKPHLSLCGIGGLGKTVSLLNLSVDTFKLYVPLRVLRGTKTVMSYIKERTLESKEELFNELMNLVNSSSKEDDTRPPLILILDGLNETNEDTRKCVVEEITHFWALRRVQIVVSSRYDASTDFLSIEMHKLQLETLTRQKIREYLIKAGVVIPEANNRIWNVIDTPLMLNLYARSENIKNRQSNVEYVDFVRPTNAGSIIWNYLQSEVLLYTESYRSIILPIIAAEFVAPYIAYRMQQNYTVSDSEMRNLIRSAIKLFDEEMNNSSLPARIQEIVDTNEGGKDSLSVALLYKALTEGISLFRKNDGMVQFIHQGFRDALAAIHILQSAQCVLDKVPASWKNTPNEYVTDYMVDLLQNSENSKGLIWEKIWELHREKEAVERTDNGFVRRMLTLHKGAYGNDVSQVNFSGLDLSEVSLTGYSLVGAPADHFVKAKIGDGTFRGDGHGMTVCSLGWNRNGTKLLSASNDCLMLIWDKKTLEREVVCDGKPHSRYIRCAKWCPDNDSIIVSAGDDNMLILWEKRNDKWEHRSVSKSSDWIYCVEWSSDCRTVLFGDRSGGVSAYTMDVGTTRYKSNHNKAVSCISASSKGLFATGDEYGRVSIWSLGTETEITSAFFAKPIKALHWVNDGSILEVFTETECVQLVPVKKSLGGFGFERRPIADVNAEGTRCVCFGSCGSEDYCAVFTDKTVSIYKSLDGPPYNYVQVAVKSINVLDMGIIGCAAWNNDCCSLAIGSRYGSVWLARVLKDEQTLERIQFDRICGCNNKSARSTSWSKDGMLLAAGYDDGIIRVWDVERQKCRWVFRAHNDSVKCISWETSNNHLQIVSGSDDGSIMKWRLEETGVVLRASKKTGSPINCVLCLGDGRTICGTDDKGLFLFSPRLTKICQECSGHSNKIYGLVSAFNDDVVVSAGNDKLLCVWDVRADGLRLMQSIESGHTEPIRSLSAARGTAGVYSAGNDCKVFFHPWKKMGKAISKAFQKFPIVHRDFIYSVVLSKNGRYIVSGSTDTTIGVYIADKKTLVGKGRGHSSYIWCVSASPKVNDRYYVASSSSDGTIRIWDVTLITDESEIVSKVCLEALPNVIIVDCDFSKAIIVNKELKRLITMNGGVIR